MPKLIVACGCLGLLAGCTSAYLQAGTRYLDQGLTPLAIEVFDQGTQREPANAELRDALILAVQSYQYELRQEIDRLKESGRMLQAVQRLLVLEESSRRAAELKVPTEDAAGVQTERRELTQKTIQVLQTSLDERVGRAHDEKSDLAACRQLLAMVVDDPGLARLCERLRNRFKWIVISEPENGSDPAASRVLAEIQRETERRRPELFAIVSPSANTHNARLQVFLGAPEVEETGWLLVDRDAFHTFVQKLGKNGQPLEEEVEVPPDRDDVEKAKKNKQPPPKPKKVKKKVWEEISGEYRVFRSERRVSVPYRLRVESLTDGTLLAELAGTHGVSAESKYHEYSGDPRGKSHKSQSTPAGRERAASLPSAPQLVDQSLVELGNTLVTSILERVE